MAPVERGPLEHAIPTEIRINRIFRNADLAPITRSYVSKLTGAHCSTEGGNGYFEYPFKLLKREKSLEHFPSESLSTTPTAFLCQNSP